MSFSVTGAVVGAAAGAVVVAATVAIVGRRARREIVVADEGRAARRRRLDEARSRRRAQITLSVLAALAIVAFTAALWPRGEAVDRYAAALSREGVVATLTASDRNRLDAGETVFVTGERRGTFVTCEVRADDDNAVASCEGVADPTPSTATTTPAPTTTAPATTASAGTTTAPTTTRPSSTTPLLPTGSSPTTLSSADG